MKIEGSNNLPRYQALETNEGLNKDAKKATEVTSEKQVWSQDGFMPSPELRQAGRKGMHGFQHQQRGPMEGFSPETGMPRDGFQRSGEMPGGPRHGHGPMGRPPFPMMGPEKQDPAKMAEKLFAEMDQDGNGSITKEELEAAIEAKSEEMKEMETAQTAQAELPTEIPVEETENDETIENVEENLVAAEGIEETEETEEVYETESLEDPTAIKEEVLAQLLALQQDSSYESLSDEQKQEIEGALQSVNELDPSDPEFLGKLQTLLYGSESE